MAGILDSLHAAVECVSSNAVHRAEIYFLHATHQEACALSILQELCLLMYIFWYLNAQ